MKLKFKNVILLSGTPTGGKYEKLWTQIHLLGWMIPKSTFYQQYVIQDWVNNGSGFYVPVVKGYKNVDRLKRKLREYGCIFMKTDECFDLPQMIDTTVSVKPCSPYWHFMQDSIVQFDGKKLIGDTKLAKRLYARQLCGQYNAQKLKAVTDLLDSTDDRILIWYNFNAEKDLLTDIAQACNKPVSLVNGEVKDLTAYEECGDSVTLIQYQAGAMGLNLQKANKAIYFTLPQSSDLFEQSKKRIHRIGQNKPCFYYYLICRDTVEGHIMRALKARKDYDDALFEEYKRSVTIDY